MRHFFNLILTVAIILLNCLPCLAAGSDHVGIIKLLAGDVTIERNGSPIKAAVNMKVMKGDQVRTGPDGKAGMIFEDDTLISMGPDSRVSIDNFLFKPS